MSLACDSCSKIIRDDTIGTMITVHLPYERPHPITGQAFVYQVEKIFCSSHCVITELITMDAARYADAG